MPISSFQAEVLHVIAAVRDPESFIAAGLPLNRSGPRISDDIDAFQDREERVARAAEEDARLLAAAGYDLRWLRREPALQSGLVSKAGSTTRLEWVVDSDFRFFPAVKDKEFGYVLHVADLAVNKLRAAVSRREPRDVVDLVTLHERHLPLGAIVWAAVVVAPGFTPEGLLAELKRNTRYAVDEFRAMKAVPPIDGAAVMTSPRGAIAAAERFVSQMPTERVGTVFIREGRAAEPDPGELDHYLAHRPGRRGHWPTESSITSAMLERLQQSLP